MSNHFDHDDQKLDQILGEKLLALPLEQAPPLDMKETVFSTLDTLDFFAEIVDLFTGKFAMAEMAILEAASLPAKEAAAEEEE